MNNPFLNILTKPNDMNKVYLKNFIFEAKSYEEYMDGACISKGKCNTTIVSKLVSHDCVAFGILDDVPVKINTRFGLPVFGYAGGDVLEDRIQYGRLPDNFSWPDSAEPVVCNIFNNMTCIRFATLSPLRIVEFYGSFSDIS